MEYDGFISYSHGVDARLAPAVQSGLQKLAKPWYKLRALKIFRDETSLAANPALWPTIEEALQCSRYFLLMASPAGAASPWVQKEVDWWLKNREAGRILIVLTDGEIAWDSHTPGFERSN